MRNKNGSSIGKESEITQQRLRQREQQICGKGRVNKLVAAVGRYFAAAHVGLEVCAGLKSLCVTKPGGLRKRVENGCALSRADGRSFCPAVGEARSCHGVEGGM